MRDRHQQFRFVLILQSILIWPISSQTFDDLHAQDLAANPSDIHFRLDTTTAKHQFQMGERIPITLEFSSSTPEKYKLNGATYDRSGRLPTEQFVSERNDVADPYRDYFGSGVLGWLAGGIRGYPVLQPKPYAIELELNDWFRFDRPGRYRFYVKSHRLTRERAPSETGEKMIQFAAASNILEIDILEADPGWEATKMAEIRGTLEQTEPGIPRPGDPPVPRNPLAEQIGLAREELRYLATRSAVQLILDRARSNSAELDTLALIGARDRADVIERFDRYLFNPEVVIREWDIRVRALFTFIEKESPEPLPMFVWQIQNPTAWHATQLILGTRQKHFEDLVRAEAVRLIPATERKAGSARKASVEAIAAIAPREVTAAGLLPPEDYGLTRPQLIEQFNDFSEEQQLELLTKKWDLVRGPEMVAVLRRIIDKAETKPLPSSAMSFRVWGTETHFVTVALQRLYELSPEETTAIIRKDFLNDKTRFAGFAVRSLPAQDLAEADAMLSALLKTNLSGALPLVAKFGTARLGKQMSELYVGESWPCAEEESFTAYFVRTQREDVAKDVLKRSMTDRELRGCYRLLLGQVAQVTWNPIVEWEALATLNDADPEAVMSAATVLAAYAGPQSEPLLWKRLEQWSAQWRGRASELQAHPITGTAPNRSEERLGSALFQAIASAKSWVIDESGRRRLLTLCVDDWCRQSWARDLLSGTILIDVSNGWESYPTAFRVQGYAGRSLADLKAKLEHFPTGSKFRWCPQSFNPLDAFTPGQLQEMFDDVLRFLSKRSMSIEPYSAEKCVPRQ
jgi:hypothetical protein